MKINFFTIEKQAVSYRWIYRIKFLSNGQIERLKAWLVVKGYI